MLPRSSWPKHAFRVATLVVPSWIAWCVAFSAHDADALTRAVKLALGPLWMLLAAALVLRTIDVLWSGRKSGSAPRLAQIDVLTGSGSALAWLSALAIVLAVWLGYASLAVVGLLGTGLFHVVVLLTFVAVRGGDPMRGASIARRFVPEVVTEGDDLAEELRFAGTRVPVGFRLFVTGRVGPRWAVSRHVLGSADSGGEVVLESEVGPALRGDYDVEPLEVWLQDTFGLCRSIRVKVGAAHLTVLPKIVQAERAALLGRGEGPRAPQPASRLPTEGHFRLREYQQGDDVRRIHWVRSLASREIIVRLPDELPPDRPRVRLVLDTFFPEMLGLTCDAPAEILDSVVRAWLAVGRALAESGAQVTLIAAVPQGGAIVMNRQELSLRAPAAALRLGARAAWQNHMLVDELLTDEPAFVVSHAVLTRPPAHGKARWILVLPKVAVGMPWPYPSGARLPFPVGSTENRWSLRRREANEHASKRRDHARALVAMRGSVAHPPPGSFCAQQTLSGGIRLEALR